MESTDSESSRALRQLLHEKRLIAFGAMRSLILYAKRLTACPSLGLQFGVSVETAAHGVTGAAIAASHDVSPALEAAIRYRPLRGRAVEFEFVAGEDGLTLFIREPFDLGDVRTFILEAHVGMIERAMSAVTGEPLIPVSLPAAGLGARLFTLACWHGSFRRRAYGTPSPEKDSAPAERNG